METKDRNCLNCAHCQKFKYSSNDKKEMMRCWDEPSVIDHAFVQTVTEGKKYVCDEHQTVKEFADEQLSEAVCRLKSAKREVRDVLERFKCLPQTPESIIHEHTWHDQEVDDIFNAVDDWDFHRFACITKGGRLLEFCGICDEHDDGYIEKHIDCDNDGFSFSDIAYWMEFPD